MTSPQPDLYQQIGQEISRIAIGATGLIANRVAAGDGWVETAVYFVRDGTVIFKFPSPELNDLLANLWESARSEGPGKQWSKMVYLIDGGRFRVEYGYGDDLLEEPPDVKQREFVKKYFGVDDWDYSDPEPPAD